MESLDLPPARHAVGTLRLPGSKSISNRVLLLAALAEGTTVISDLLRSDDVERMLEALRSLGVDWQETAPNEIRVPGQAGRFPARQADLFLGNAGTALRPLTAVLALSDGHYRLSGVARMHERPIGDLVDALRPLGARIDYRGTPGYPPLEILPAQLGSVDRLSVRGDVSSQFLTALLMALPLTGAACAIEVEGELISQPYIEITLNLMARFGVRVEHEDWRVFHLPENARYRSPGRFAVEADASAASYFLAAGAIGGGPVRVLGVGRESIQGDVRFAEALAAMGARIAMGPDWIEARAPESGRLRAIELDGQPIPDAAMTLAVAALFAEGTTRLSNIASWRVKETDRIAAMATELRKLGATVEEGSGDIAVSPPLTFPPAVTIDTYDDHRMAMCFSLACLSGVSTVRINDPRCVAKTYPDYFAHFAALLAPVIAIDGPSASGKGTVAARLAQRLGFHYLDSGALYRLLALAAIRAGTDLDDESQLARLAGELPARFAAERILLAEEEVSQAIRSEACSAAASRVAVFPAVRAALLDRQRAWRWPPGLVAEGRDIGSVVFPQAVFKIFLTASVEARADRRYKQLIDKGMSASMSTLLQDLRERDARDAARSVAPLQKCADAELLDTTAMTIDEAVDWAIERLRQRLPALCTHP